MEYVKDISSSAVNAVFNLLGGHQRAPEVVFGLTIVVILLVVWILKGRGPVGWVMSKLNLSSKCGGSEGFTPSPLAPGVASRWAVPERTDTGASDRTDRFMNMVSKSAPHPSVADIQLAQGTFAADNLGSGVFAGGVSAYSSKVGNSQSATGVDSTENLSNFSDASLIASSFNSGLGVHSAR